MNAPSSLNRSNKKALLLLVAALLLTIPAAGCSFFGTTAKPEKEEKTVEKVVPPGMISTSRIAARKRTGTFICLISDSGKPFAFYDPAKNSWQGIEPQIMREIAKKMKMKVQFIRMPARNISGALRSGRGDIAAAKLDTGTIKSLCFVPVAAYAPTAKGKLAFMVRTDDAQWQKALSDAAATVNINKIVSGNSSTIGSVRVKLANDNSKAVPVVTVKQDNKKAQAAGKDTKTAGKPTDKKAGIVPPKQNGKQIKVVPAAGKTKLPKQEKNKK